MKENRSNLNSNFKTNSGDDFYSFVLKAFGAEKTLLDSDFHGQKNDQLIFICPIDSTISASLTDDLLNKCSKQGFKNLVLLSFLYDDGLLPGIIKIARSKGIKLDARIILPQALAGGDPEVTKFIFPCAYKDPFAKLKKWLKRIILVILLFYGPLAIPCNILPYLNCSYGGIYHWHWEFFHNEILEINGEKFFAGSQTVFGGLRPIGEPYTHGGFYCRKGNDYYLIPWNLISWTISLNRAPLKYKSIIWGERHYLVPEYSIENFNYAVKQEWEPRNEEFGFDAIYLKQGDHKKIAIGIPQILP